MSPHNSRHGTTCSISSRNTCRRVFFVYRSKPFIVARLLCCLFVDLIWRNLLYIPVERETLFRVSLGKFVCVPSKVKDRDESAWCLMGPPTGSSFLRSFKTCETICRCLA